jgi:hypothetical protein
VVSTMRMCRAAIVIMLGCGSIDSADCDERKTKRSCERANAEPGECRWLEVRTPVVDGDTCNADPPSHGECVGISNDTAAGCGVVECGGAEPAPVYFKTVGDHVEVLVSPVCGGAGPLSGDWEACTGSDAADPAECSCACAP